MNSGCWLNSGVPQNSYVGQPYRDAFVAFAQKLVAKGFAVILDLHWTLDPGISILFSWYIIYIYISISEVLDWRISKFRCRLRRKRFPFGKASQETLSSKVFNANIFFLILNNTKRKWEKGEGKGSEKSEFSLSSSQKNLSVDLLLISCSASSSDNGAVIFDLFNEPFPDANTADSDNGWRCWRDGGQCPGSA